MKLRNVRSAAMMPGCWPGTTGVRLRLEVLENSIEDLGFLLGFWELGFWRR